MHPGFEQHLGRHACAMRAMRACAALLLAIPLPLFAAPASHPASAPSTRAASQPATRPASQPAVLDRNIRVLILDGIASCQLAIQEPFDVVDLDRAVSLLHRDAIERLTVRFDRGQTWLPELEIVTDSRRLAILPAGSKPVLVGMAKGTRAFRGRLRIVRQAPASGSLINVVDIEDYLAGVVSAELPASFHQEAFRAQTIAARTYAWYGKVTAGARSWDVASTEASQVYLGMDREATAGEALKAVRDTCGLVCTWMSPEGPRVFCTYYSSTCGGSTQPLNTAKNEPLIPPLAGGVVCDYCKNSPTYRWGPVRVDKEVMTRRLRDRLPALRQMDVVDSVAVAERTPEGRPTRMVVKDVLGREIKLEAESFRLAVDPTGRELKSSYFTAVIDPDAITFQDGRGFGHGLGMCQYGAEGMALAGKHAAEILRYYYPGAQITRAY